MGRQPRNSKQVTQTNKQIARGSPAARFINKIGDMLGLNVSPAHKGATLDAYEADAGETSRSVEKAAKRGDARGRQARKAKARKTAATKPAARKIAQRRGAKMAPAAKADTVDRAKAASRANRTAKSRGGSAARGQARKKPAAKRK